MSDVYSDVYTDTYGGSMSIWLDGVTRVPASTDGGSMVGGPPRGVLHTTEGTTAAGAIAAMRQANSWSHLTSTFEDGHLQTFQHIPLDRAARALRNPTGGVQTNRQGTACVQIEIVGFASHADQFTTGYLQGLAALMRQVEAATGIARRSTVTWKAYPSSYGLANGVRLSDASWNGYAGWLGHQHVPENDHGDPGLINIAALLSGQEDDMTIEELEQALTSNSVVRAELRELALLGSQDTLRTAVAGAKDKAAGPYFQALARDMVDLKAGLASVTGEIDATQTAIANLQLAAVDPPALAAALGPLLGADLADKVAAELSARLAQ